MSSKNSVASEDWENVEDDPNRWFDVFGNGDLKRRILRKATIVLESDESASQVEPKKPSNGDIVKIKVHGLIDKQGDESQQQRIDEFDDIEFELGLNDVITAWEMTVQLMSEGEINEVRTSPRFAYGLKGREPDVPPNSYVTYIIELLSIETGTSIYDMSLGQRIIFCEKRKLRGNHFFKRDDFMRAAEVYKKGVSAAELGLEDVEQTSEFKALRDVLIALYNNLAMTHLKMQEWSDAVDTTEKCLALDSRNAKGLYRRAKAFQGARNYENALAVYESIVEYNYEIKDVKLEIQRCRENIKRDRDRMKRLCEKMVLGDCAQRQRPTSPWSKIYRRIACASVIGFTALGVAYGCLRFINRPA